MREILAMLRTGWLSALSYRLNLAFSIVGLAITLVPVYFVAQSLQPVAAASIQNEGRQYFAFLTIGLAVLTVVTTAVTSPPGSIGGAIGSGTLEAMLATPASVPALLLGLTAYDMSWSFLRASLILLTSALLGSQLRAAGIPLALLALVLTLAAYYGAGLALAGMILLFRTVGPLATGTVAASALLGGAYYSTTVIPSWIRELSSVVPLTYGLRVMRRALLDGVPLGLVRGDLLRLTILALILLPAGMAALAVGLRSARREGSLGQY